MTACDTTVTVTTQLAPSSSPSPCHDVLLSLLNHTIPVPVPVPLLFFFLLLLLLLHHHHDTGRPTATNTTTSPAATAATTTTTTTIPPRKPRLRDCPVRQLRYWTADAEGSTTIGKWLAEELEEDRLAFFASFINWCSKQMQRVKNPQTGWPSAEEKERASNMRVVLHTQPLDARAYIGLMQEYRKRFYVSGWAVGHIRKPESADVYDLMKGQDRLLEAVFTRIERERMLVTGGREYELSRKSKRRVVAQAKDAALAAAAADEDEDEDDGEEGEEDSPLAQWGATKDAVGEVEKEVEDEDAIGASSKWGGQLIDRTK